MQRYAGALLFVLIVAGSSACSSEDDTASACSSCGTGGSGTGGTGPDPAIDGYCRDKTPALIAAAGDPVEPVAPLTEEPVADSSCNAVVRTYPIAASPHVAPCNPVEYDTNPPTSGNHYGNFPRYAAYDYAIPRGFWVHSLEHGAVVLAYSCTDCQGDVEQATALVNDAEPAAACCTAAGCSASVSNQLVLTPDPGLSTAWAAASWGVALTADCYEPAVFEAFVMDHRDNGAPERVCDNSYAVDVTKPGPG